VSILKSNHEDSTNNFWISYADLMAGLLFIFILLLGAIITKYIIVKSDASRLEQSLHSEQSLLDKTKSSLASVKKLVLIQDEEIANLKLEKDHFRQKILTLNQMVEEAKRVIYLKEENILKLIDSESSIKQKVISLEELIDNLNSIVTTKDEELVKLLEKIKQQDIDHEKLVSDLNVTKSKIKNLTGIKIRVISALKRALGTKMVVDSNSGAIRLSSSILFDQGDSKLKDSAKVALKEIFSDYIRVLLDNDNIRKHLDKVVIEGHTNSDGSYLYNLNLSQSRAYEVMSYLLTLDLAKKYNIKKIVIASGRSYLDTIVNSSGIEDKDASRRIEIKFLLKNDSAMREIEKIVADG
jgi:chemotaxis protein MotB